MRYGLLLLGCLATACGGNLSNDDLEFLNALPAREDLAAKLPGAEASASSREIRSRVDRLELPALGTPSQTYLETRRVSEEFNTALDGLLALLEAIRQLPPTQREPDRRLWGPMSSDQPGQEVRFLMERHAEQFAYRLQVRRAGAGEEAWWSLIEGTFQAGRGLRRGAGQVSLRLAPAKARGLDVGELAYLDRLDFNYQTHSPPIQVEALLVPAAGQSTTEVRHAYRELPGSLGEMGFMLASRDLVRGDALEELHILSRWTRERGVGVVTVRGGDLPTGVSATQVE
jgi:hypothetical protein